MQINLSSPVYISVYVSYKNALELDFQANLKLFLFFFLTWGNPNNLIKKYAKLELKHALTLCKLIKKTFT